MQLMPATAAAYGVDDLFDIEQNIRGGVRFLKHLKSRYGENLRLLLAAYNAGETLVERAGGEVPQIGETQQYVVDVLHHYRNRGGSVPEPLPEAQAQKRPRPKTAKGRAPERRVEKQRSSRPIRVWVDKQGRVVISNVP
jgi:hypothetical protein